MLFSQARAPHPPVLVIFNDYLISRALPLKRVRQSTEQQGLGLPRTAAVQLLLLSSRGLSVTNTGKRCILRYVACHLHHSCRTLLALCPLVCFDYPPVYYMFRKGVEIYSCLTAAGFQSAISCTVLVIQGIL